MKNKSSYSKILKTDEISSIDCKRMFAILSEHFANLKFDIFERDLREKDWIVTIYSGDDKIEGFSTLKVLTQEFEGEKMHAFFSGDTVLSKAFSGNPTWIPVWADHVFAQAELMSPEKCYWLLLTATHRTYRILPTCFKQFAPNPKQPTNKRFKQIMDNFVTQKFPDEYDPDQGVVILSDSIPYKEVEEIKAQQGEHHFYTKYFREINPTFDRGNFLCCMTEIDPANVTPSGLRILYDSQPVAAIN
jgi:hypothetical protein